MSDSVAALAWAVGIWSVALLVFPLVRPLCPHWPDQGYGLARVAGPLWLGLLTWILHTSARLPWSRATALLALTLLASASLVAYRRFQPSTPLQPARAARIDAVWLLTTAGFLMLRTWSPAIHGAERPMDHALLAAVTRAASLPPEDPWLSGFVVNYHYAGYAFLTPLAWLCALPFSATYNLVLAGLAGMTVAATTSVGMRIGPARWPWGAAALVAAAPVTVLVQVLLTRRVTAAVFPPTRSIPGTFNEYPLFSLAWGDLHPHVIAMAWLPLVVGGLIALDDLLGQDRTFEGRRRVVAGAMATMAAAVACVLTSTWDGLTLTLGLLLWAVAMAVRHGARSLARGVGPALMLGALIAYPVLATFRPPAVPWGFEWTGSPLGVFLVTHGIWLTPLGLLAIRPSLARPLLTLVLLGAWAACGLAAPGFAVRVGLALLLVAILKAPDLETGVRLLLAWALAVWLLSESIWMDDVYGWAMRRTNTAFKWPLHAMVLGATALPAVMEALARTPAVRWRRALQSAFLLAASLALVAAVGVVGGLWRQRMPQPSLDALSRLDRVSPGDAEAVRYLWTHAAAGDVLLEAPGRSYTSLSRISALTGAPTLLGWEGHERLWRRGASWEAVIDDRRATADALLRGEVSDLAATLRAHRVRYIVIGPAERRRHGARSERFASVADVVMRHAGTEVLRVR